MPALSVVVPVYNESGNAGPLALEIAAAFEGRDYEMIFVDDASKDATRAELTALKPELPGLRVISHASNAGQSRAIRTGVLAARAPVIVTMDGDGQNPPGDAPRLVDRLLASPPEVAMVSGRRVKRQDSPAKQRASRWANEVRKRLLNDRADDTGCGLKAMRRDAFLRLPYFDHMHRYIPALMIREGFEIAFEDVGHRPRQVGSSKYDNLGRLAVAFADLQGVMWLNRRARKPGACTEA